MRVVLSSDQEFFRATTAKFLAQQVPVDVVRRLRDDTAGFDRFYWRQGAELGWTSLLVSEAHGGGSISGAGLVDLTLVAHEFGAHAAPGPLSTTNVVGAALGEAGAHGEVISGLLSGDVIASWCFAEPGGRGLDNMALDVAMDGTHVVVNGIKGPVESAAQADHLLVTGRSGDGLTQVLVPAEVPGVSLRPMSTVDLTRRFFEVTFDAVRLPSEAVLGAVGAGREQVQRQIDLAVVIANAEMVGAMQAAFEMTVEWAFDRYSFGRPLASYQELKHRFADMKTWLEASHAINDAAAAAVECRSERAGELVSAAKSFIGDYGGELLQDCVQIHGGIGLTFEHDLHLYLRRHTMNRALFGTAEEHRQRITLILEGSV
jgi:alkylation response protein AidB-like acyl-CoA dehydrogenase